MALQKVGSTACTEPLECFLSINPLHMCFKAAGRDTSCFKNKPGYQPKTQKKKTDKGSPPPQV